MCSVCAAYVQCMCSVCTAYVQRMYIAYECVKPCVSGAPNAAKKVEEVLDMELIKQQIEQDAFNLRGVVEFIVSIMAGVCIAYVVRMWCVCGAYVVRMWCVQRMWCV